MRAIVWGINYAPEFTGIAPHSVALCEFLHARGDDVAMVTSFAYYPTW
jgi:colanic acid biosynthesis glycosyl transferase WcaI